jgi:signal transduction histidine kinase
LDVLTCHRREIVAVAAIGGLTAASVYGSYASGTSGGLLAVEIIVGIVACGLLPVLFRRPVTGALVLAALAAVAATATPASTTATLQVARHRTVPTAIGVAMVGITAHAVRYLWQPMTGLSFGWWLILVVAAHASLVGWGALAQARRALIASLRDRARRAEAEQGRRVAEARAAERARMAGEMHDVLAHRLSLLATYAGALEYRPDHPPERLSHAAGVIRSAAHQALDELREVIMVLRDDLTDDGPHRPLPTLADLPDLVEESRATGTPVDVHDTLPDPAELPAATGRTAYRVVQEALTNARKHAPGQPVRITLDGIPGTHLTVDVTNPLAVHPANVTAPPPIPGAGSGLIGLTERVRLAGGQLEHQTSSGQFRLHTWLPWPA